MSTRTSQKQILVIDDEPGFRDLYSFMLEPLGHHVDTAKDGLLGLRMVGKKAYDLILLDVHMPNMGGVEVLKHIRDNHPEQKVIMFSSNSDPTHCMEDKARELGVCDFLYKPMDWQEISSVIDCVLSVPITR